MSRKILLIPLLLTILVALAACGGANGQPDAAPTAAVTAAVTEAVPTAGSPSPTPEAAGPTAAPPTAEPQPTATAEPTPAALCPDLPRPALVVGSGPTYEAVDVDSGARCPLSLPETLGYLQPAAGSMFFVLFDHDAGSSVVQRVGGDNAVESLENTRATSDVHYLLRFAAAPDGSRLAWSHMRPQADPNATSLLGSLWVGDPTGGDPVAILADEPGREMRIVAPLRFSAGGETLFFSWEPIGLGGIWSAFNGRYDNLWRVPAAGGVPELAFDCDDRGLFLCLGDFRDDGTLAIIDLDNTIHVIGPDGAELAAFPTSGDYAGYPTFNQAGDLFYSEAALDEDEQTMPLPAPGTIYRVAAPYDGPPQVVASGPGLLLSGMRDMVLDAERLVVNYEMDGLWGAAVLDAAGEITPVEPWPNAYPAAVWR